MRKPKIRVIIPTSPEEAIAVGLKAVAKHEQDGENSPLRGLDMGALKRKLAVAETENARSKEFHQKGEACTQNRDNEVGTNAPLSDGTIRFFLVAIRDVLLGNFKGHERLLADWGFDVVGGARHGVDEPPPAASEDPNRKAT